MRKTLRQVLARNLDKFYASSPVASSDAELGRRAEIDQTMVRRYRLMIVDPTLDKVEKLAKGMGVHPLQLLSPDFSPLIQEPGYSVEALYLAKLYDAITDPREQRRAWAIANLVLQGGAPAEVLTPPVEVLPASDPDDDETPAPAPRAGSARTSAARSAKKKPRRQH